MANKVTKSLYLLPERLRVSLSTSIMVVSQQKARQTAHKLLGGYRKGEDGVILTWEQLKEVRGLVYLSPTPALTLRAIALRCSRIHYHGGRWEQVQVHPANQDGSRSLALCQYSVHGVQGD